MAIGRIAYLMSRFPHLPETFILREMNGMAELGWQVELFPLIFQKQEVIHEEALEWVEKAHRLPFFSIGILRDNIHLMISRPGTFFSILAKTFTGNFLNPGFLIKSLIFFPKMITMADSMKRLGVEHIHAHYATYPALAAWAINRLTGIPYSVTVHAHDIFEDKPMLSEKLENARFIIAISEFNRDYLLKILGADSREKIHVVHCGVRHEAYQSAHVDFHRNEKFQIVHIGSLEPYKGQKYLVEACRLLKEKQIMLHVSIIGMGYEKQALEGLISRYDLEDEVTLEGPKTQEEIAAILPQAHCYVQPSIITSRGTMEGIPVALMEAMACGIPVIATAISGIPELIEDGRNGLLLPPEDPAALAAAIESIITDYTAALKMGLRGQEKVQAEFDLHKNVKELDAIISSTLDDNKHNMPVTKNQP